MTMSMVDIGQHLLRQNLALKEGEQLLIIVDETTLSIGQALFAAGVNLGARAIKMQMPLLGKSGREPVPIVSQAMPMADVVVAATAYSLTHTQARKRACAAGARIATMPGITEEMFAGGALAADYEKIAARTHILSDLLTTAREALLINNGARLTMSLDNRQGIPSTGIYHKKGQAGNLPSGEAYIAPVEGSAEGEIIIDGSFAGIGTLQAPLKLMFAQGVMVDAVGPDSDELLAMLGDEPLARNLAELGIGTNDKARIIGVILEDEKVYGTAHIALGSNDTFGGQVAAGIHVDGIMLTPELYLDGQLILRDGKLQV
jgi:leucyl aminopeptidase (aminopeptidase T)